MKHPARCDWIANGNRDASFGLWPVVLGLALAGSVALFALALAQVPFQTGMERGDGAAPSTGHVTFDTVPGCRYRLFTSTDLRNWAPVEPAFYGFGGE